MMRALRSAISHAAPSAATLNVNERPDGTSTTRLHGVRTVSFDVPLTVS